MSVLFFMINARHFTKEQNFRIAKLGSFAAYKSILLKQWNLSQKGNKILWEMKKILATTILSNVSKTIFLRVNRTTDCMRKELTHSHTMTPFDAPGKQAF